MEIESIITEIKTEYERSKKLYNDFNSNHEAYAVILEELDEVWDEIKKTKEIRGNENIHKELIQVGAMVVKYIENLC